MKKKKKLENKFFGPFYVFYIIEKQAYKLKLFIKYKKQDLFYVSVPEQDNTKKKRVNNPLPESKREFKVRNNKKHNIEAINNSIV